MVLQAAVQIYDFHFSTYSIIVSLTETLSSTSILLRKEKNCRGVVHLTRILQMDSYKLNIFASIAC